MKYNCYVCLQGFEGSIVAENFSSSDPCSNDPMVHGELDSGGGLVSFQPVSRNGFNLILLEGPPVQSVIQNWLGSSYLSYQLQVEFKMNVNHNCIILL